MTAELTNRFAEHSLNGERVDMADDGRIEWYARSEVDVFLEAAARQRAELEAEIAAAEARAERARAAAGLHRLMATMVLDTQRELAEVRREAEAKARAIVQAGTVGDDVDTVAPEDLDRNDPPATIDLVAASARDAGADQPLAAPASLGNGEADTQEGDAEFLAFLRDGLQDPGPLGPPSTAS